MAYLTSGNQIVDDMGKINISGNVIPQIWYSTITRTNGKPYLLAITLLSDIVYWYRPAEVRDENSGQIIGWRKRFKGDILQRTYQQYADLYGESKRSIKAALDRLEELGVIAKEFRDVPCENGMVLYNLMYISLDSKVLKQLTYPEMLQEHTVNIADDDTDEILEPYESPDLIHRDTTDSDTLLQNNVGGMTAEKRGVQQNNDRGDTKICRISPQNDVGGGTKFCRGYDRPLYGVQQNDVRGGTTEGKSISQKNVPGLTGNCRTNTEITTENTNGDYIYPIYQEKPVGSDSIDAMDEFFAYKEMIQENIDYQCLIRDARYQNAMIDEIVELIAETVSIRRESIRIGGADYPYQMVKSRFLKLDSSHIQYVMECLRNSPSKIGNIRAYLLTALFNAPNTIDNYYQAEVNYDLHGMQRRW